jgi:predicted NBD/HSP70 family sugar kinase
MSYPREPIDTAQVREQNVSLLLELIWRERQLSRAELSRRSGMSPSTVSTIVAELCAAGLVREIGEGASRGGRKPTLLAFCDDAYFTLGIELGARHLSAALIDLRGHVHGFATCLHELRDDPKGTLTLAHTLVSRCRERTRIAKKQLVGVGVAVPSPVDPSRPGELSEVYYPAWQGVDVRGFFASSYGVPAFTENDANSGALCERFWGAGRGADAIAYVKVGRGLGAGLVFGGELYRGAGGVSGEIGHIPLDLHGPECSCGNRGCITMYVGAGALDAQAARCFGPGERASVSENVRRARLGDVHARQIVDDVGQNLGVVLAGLLNLLNPNVLVLGGEITGVGDLLLDPLRAALRKRVLAHVFAQTRIATSSLGERTVAVGAATLVLQKALADRRMFALPARESA